MIHRAFTFIVLSFIVSTNISAQTIIPAGPVSGTWTNTGSPYKVQGDIKIASTKELIIEAGVDVIFENYYEFRVEGKLRAIGTASDSISFSNGGIGTDWKGIRFFDTDLNGQDSSILTYCIISEGDASSAIPSNYGAGIYMSNSSDVRFDHCRIFANTAVYGAVYCDAGSDALIKNSRVHNNNSEGLMAGSSNPSFIACDVIGNSGDAISIGGASSPRINYCYINNNNGTGIVSTIDTDQPVLLSNIIKGNNGNAISCFVDQIRNFQGNTCQSNTINQISVAGGTITHDAVWEETGASYYIHTAHIYVQGQDGGDLVTTLSIDPGVTVEFDNFYLYIGHNSNASYPGGLIAEGTLADPIVFTSSLAIPTAGSWYGLFFANYADDALCRLNHCEVAYGGYSSYENIYCYSASPSITNTNIHRGSGAGIFLTSSSNPLIDSCNIHENTTSGIRAENSDFTIHNSLITDNALFGIHMVSGCDAEIKHCDLNDNGSSGLYAQNEGQYPVVDSNEINNNNSYPVRAKASMVSNFTNNTYVGNFIQKFLVSGDTIFFDGSWEAPGIPYYIDDDDIVISGVDGPDATTVLTIEPATILQFLNGYGLYVGQTSPTSRKGGLIAEGTPSQPIVFTSGEASQTRGDWYGIEFTSNAEPSLCNMRHTEVGYGGSVLAGIILGSVKVNIRRSEIHHCLGYGIFINQNTNPLIDSCRIYDNGTHGVYCSQSSPILRHDTISNHPSWGMVLEGTGSPEVDYCLIENNSVFGIYISNTAVTPTVSNCSISNNPGVPIRLYASQLGPALSGNTYVGNSNQQVFVIGNTIQGDAVWENPGIPFGIYGHIYVQGQDGPDAVATLTLDPGCELRFNASYLYIGHNSNTSYPGGLIAEGTEAEPIIFTSEQMSPAPGDWYGIYFANYSDDALCRLDYCEVAYGGYSSYENIYCYSASPSITNTNIHHGSGPGIYMTNSSTPVIDSCNIHENTTSGIRAENSDFTIHNSLLTDNALFGIHMVSACDAEIKHCDLNDNGSSGVYAQDEGQYPVVDSNEINNNNSYPARAKASMVSNFTNNTYVGNFIQKFLVNGDTIFYDGVWEEPGIPYYVDDDNIVISGIDGADAATGIILEPGITMQFNTGYGIFVGQASVSSRKGGLMAEGTAIKPIVFTSAQSSPAAGDWTGIVFTNKAEDNQCSMLHTEVSYGGSGIAGVNMLANKINIRRSHIHHNNGYGIYLHSNTNPLIDSCNIHHNSIYGIRASSSSPVLRHDTISNSGMYGIFVENICSPIVDSCVIDANQTYGIFLSTGNSNPVISNSSISNTIGHPVKINANLVGNVMSDNTYSGNTLNTIHVSGTTVYADATWPDPGIPYEIFANHLYVQGQWGTDNVTTLTLDPGCELRFGAFYLYVGHNSNSAYPGGLMAIGADTNRIVFTSDQAVPSAGDWNGIYFARYALDSECHLEYCDVKYGGNGAGYDNIHCYYGAPTLVNCEISYGDGNGIYYDNSVNPGIRNCFIHDNTSNGIYSNNSSPYIYNSNLTDHTGNGLLIASGSGPRVYNSMFYNNGTGVSAPASLSAMAANNFWLNTVDFSGTAPAGFGSVTTTNVNGDPCDIYANLFLNPNCINPGGRNYQLGSSSVCQNAGDPSGYDPSYPFDLLGHTRLLGSRIDIGAYEYGIYWEGDISNDWHLPANWSNNEVPSASSDVNIWPGYTNRPIISASVTVQDLILWDGVFLEITNGAILTVGP